MKSKKNPHFKDSYPTIEEAAKAKSDYLFKVVLKDFDVSQITKLQQK